VNIIVASPESNGFFGASGLSGYIPSLYNLCIILCLLGFCFDLSFVFFFFRSDFPALMEFANASRHDTKIQLFEYAMEKWTFHAKGLWISGADTVENMNSKELVTLIGSSNYSMMVNSMNYCNF
jgi:CDP-diacylglycerol--glycerol-3-phosphate 3-phosphatidyltransferase